MKLRALELTQKRFPVGLGPSSNTWPMWAPQVAQPTSVRASDGLHTNSSKLAPTGERKGAVRRVSMRLEDLGMLTRVRKGFGRAM